MDIQALINQIELARMNLELMLADIDDLRRLFFKLEINLTKLKELLDNEAHI